METMVQTFDEIDDALKNVEESIGDSEELQNHIDDTDIHVTAEEKESWDGKADGEHTHDEYATAEHTHTPAEVGITYGTTDPEAGTSELATGKIYLAYE